MRADNAAQLPGGDANETAEREPEKDFLGIRIALCALMAMGAMMPIWIMIARV